MGFDDSDDYNIPAHLRAPVEAAPVLRTPLATQIGGQHYKKLAIQPVEYIHANGIGYFEGNAIKYVTRWRDKGGLEDLQKARHYIELLIELETREHPCSPTPKKEI